MTILIGLGLFAILKLLLVLVSIIAVITWIVIAIITSIKVNKQFDETDRAVKNLHVMSDKEFERNWEKRWNELNNK